MKNGIYPLFAYETTDILSNKYNERAKNAMEHVKAVGQSKFVNENDANVIITMGGDGTILKTIHTYYDKLDGITR